MKKSIQNAYHYNIDNVKTFLCYLQHSVGRGVLPYTGRISVFLGFDLFSDIRQVPFYKRNSNILPYINLMSNDFHFHQSSNNILRL